MSQGRPRPAQTKKDKPRTLERILSLSEDDLKERYPHGIVSSGTREALHGFIPAEFGTSGINHTPLTNLLAARKVKPERLRYLRANPGASGPRWKEDENGKLVPDPNDDGKHDYTERADQAVAGEWTLDDDTLEEYAKENGNRFAAIKAEELHRREARSMAAQVRELYALARRQGQDVPEIRRAIEEAEKRLREAA